MNVKSGSAQVTLNQQFSTPDYDSALELFPSIVSIPLSTSDPKFPYIKDEYKHRKKYHRHRNPKHSKYILHANPINPCMDQWQRQMQ